MNPDYQTISSLSYIGSVEIPLIAVASWYISDALFKFKHKCRQLKKEEIEALGSLSFSYKF